MGNLNVINPDFAEEMDRARADLLVEFKAGEIPLANCCEKYFGMNEATAARAAANHNLPVPAHKISKRKAPWLVNVEDLARLIVASRRDAEQVWKLHQEN